MQIKQEINPKWLLVFKGLKNGYFLPGVPVVAHWKGIWLVFVRTQVWSLASLSGLRILHCRELRCRSQMCSDLALLCRWHRPATTVLNSSLSLGTSICWGCGPKKTKKKNKNKNNFFFFQSKGKKNKKRGLCYPTYNQKFLLILASSILLGAFNGCSLLLLLPTHKYVKEKC